MSSAVGRLSVLLKRLCDKQCGSRPDQEQSDQHPNCLSVCRNKSLTKHLNAADEFSRRHFQMLFFVGGEGLKTVYE